MNACQKVLLENVQNLNHNMQPIILFAFQLEANYNPQRIQ